ncbi:MAG TPA: DUF3833 family protein [Caulobacteraceae bacterium]|nr:DUF3833 family protein [Caulobacteraceae bacterium]
MTATPRIFENLTFRPERFFIGQTVGGGVLRDPFFRITRRFRVETRGYRDGSYGGIKLDETYAYDTGEVEAFQWMITPAGAGRYVLAEASMGSGIMAYEEEGEVIFAYRRPLGPARGLAKPRFTVRMGLVGGDTVLKSVRVGLLGAPLGTVTAFHRRAVHVAGA